MHYGAQPISSVSFLIRALRWGGEKQRRKIEEREKEDGEGEGQEAREKGDGK